MVRWENNFRYVWCLLRLHTIPTDYCIILIFGGHLVWQFLVWIHLVPNGNRRGKHLIKVTTKRKCYIRYYHHWYVLVMQVAKILLRWNNRSLFIAYPYIVVSVEIPTCSLNHTLLIFTHVAMKIQCSDATYHLLKEIGGFQLECHGDIPIMVICGFELWLSLDSST